MSGGIVTTLFIIGIVLFVLEIFIPGGILGLLGLGFVVMAIFMSAGSIIEGVIYVVILFAVLGVVLYVGLRSPRTRRFWKRLLLSDRQLSETGYTAPKPQYKDYVGRMGRALTKLRPAGTGEFNGERLDVVSEGDFIDEGAGITIIGVEGTRIIVRKVE